MEIDLLNYIKKYIGKVKSEINMTQYNEAYSQKILLCIMVCCVMSCVFCGCGVNYEIKTIEKKKDNEFEITLEKTYPKPISKKILYGYHICRTKEIRDNILKSGIRVKYKGFEPKNKYEEKWSKLYFISDCKINDLKYIISKARKLLRCKKEESPVVRFKIPENATIYKDKTMDKLNDCYFMYCSIPPKYIENSTL